MNAKVEVNFGQQPFKHLPNDKVQAYANLCKQNVFQKQGVFRVKEKKKDL